MRTFLHHKSFMSGNTSSTLIKDFSSLHHSHPSPTDELAPTFFHSNSLLFAADPINFDYLYQRECPPALYSSFATEREFALYLLHKFTTSNTQI